MCVLNMSNSPVVHPSPKSPAQVIAPTDEVIDKIRSFITLKLPAGFPIKFELPVYPTVAVRCHFADVKMKIDPGEFLRIDQRRSGPGRAAYHPC